LPALAAVAALAAAPERDRPPARLSLPDPAGKVHALPGPGEARAVVLFFTAVECPNAVRYLPRVAELHKACSGRGVRFLALYPNALDGKDEIAKQAGDFKLPFPALLDADQRAADAYGVTVTPTAVLLDAAGKVRYRGAVDDNKAERLAGKHYLRDALDAVLAGKEVAVRETEPAGCTIQRKLAESKQPTVTYASHVGRILHAKCASCHRPGQVGPFSLLTYDQARRWATNIKAYTQSGAMPPWKPVNRGTFHGERWLPQEEIDLLARWADAGAPLGDPARVPPPPKFPDGWRLGQPDLVLEADEYEVAAEGSDEYRCFVLDPKLTRNRHVTAVEFLPGNPRIVHHAMTYIDLTGASVKLLGKDGKPGYSSRGTGPGFVPLGDLGGWGPGGMPIQWPEGMGRLLPRGSRIVLEVHYHKSGKPEKDRTRLGLHFARGPVKQRVRSTVVLNLRFRIPPGEKRHQVDAEWEVPDDLHAVAIQPHMHLTGREIKVTALLPDKTEKVMVHVKDWDFNQQELYQFQKPFALPAGTKVRLTAWFDNSADNPNNPNKPPKMLRFGEQTTDEMCVAYINYVRDKEE
ncbi:MAG TPA: redoxin domain-containing protein, partial [Gemmataceae bacterium]|nr:redoxin domain-containing protein [Gemmataceae bacterium]